MTKMVSEPLSVSALSILTGRDRRTIAGKLKNVPPVRREGRSNLYDSAQALASIYIGGDSGEGALDHTHESARLKKAQADKTELEVTVLRGELVPADEVSESWGEMVGAFRAKLLALPASVSPSLVGLSMREIQREIKTFVFEALEELSTGSNGARAGVGRPAISDVCKDGTASRSND